MTEADSLNAGDGATASRAAAAMHVDIIKLVLAHCEPPLGICELSQAVDSPVQHLVPPFVRWAQLLLRASSVSRTWHDAAQPMLRGLFVSSLDDLVSRRSRGLPLHPASVRCLACGVISIHDDLLATCAPYMRTLVADFLGDLDRADLAAPALRTIVLHRARVSGLRMLCAAAPGLYALRLEGLQAEAAEPLFGDEYADWVLAQCGQWPTMANLVELDVGGDGETVLGLGEVVTLLLSACGGELKKLATRSMLVHWADEGIVQYAGRLRGIRHLILDEFGVEDVTDTPFETLPLSVRRIGFGFPGGTSIQTLTLLQGVSPLDALRMIRDALRAGRWRQLDALSIALAPRQFGDREQAVVDAILADIRVMCGQQNIECSIWTKCADAHGSR